MSWRFQHHSRQLAFRNPFGAVKGGTTIEICVEANFDASHDTAVSASEALQQAKIELVAWTGLYEFGKTRLLATEITSLEANVWRYHFVLPTPNEGALVFYYFAIDTDVAFLLRDDGKNDGSSVLWHEVPQIEPSEQKIGGAFSITVTEPDFATPDWAKGAVVEQVFPDRLRRSAEMAWPPEPTCRDYERIYHATWDEAVDIVGKPCTGYLACDFFGGDLKGITAELDRYAANGVEVLYLNPIFAARSNHRYDTADYESIDPLLGTEADFSGLVSKANELGIRLILDGVFNHTGADSKYFNREGRYLTNGAWQTAIGAGDSPYASWFSLDATTDPPTYDSWWGFPDLPNVLELAPAFREYITGNNGILRRWLRQGVSGWRLDVSDELPDAFLRALRRAVKAENPEAYIVGEIWEDASRQVSYGAFRDFLLGRTHDAAMNYPFRTAVVDWLIGEDTAAELAMELMSLVENYPLDSLYTNMNMLGSHDTVRICSALSGVSNPPTREAQLQSILTPSELKLAERRLVLARLIQCGFPGMMHVYYGDEYGAEGWSDPCNRQTYRPQRMDEPLAQITAAITRLRRDHQVLKTGFLTVDQLNDDVVYLRRYFNDESSDAFGKQQAGVQNAEFWLNRSSVEQILPDGVVLSSFGYNVLLDGEALQFS